MVETLTSIDHTGHNAFGKSCEKPELFNMAISIQLLPLIAQLYATHTGSPLQKTALRAHSI